MIPNRWIFSVPGRAIGHKCSPAAAFGSNFRSFKRTVRLLANVASVPQELDPKGVYSVETTVYFRLKAHTDVENIRKAILDSLWDRDRRVLVGSYIGVEDSGLERVDVVITRIR